MPAATPPLLPLLLAASALPASGFTFLSVGDWGAAAAKKLNPIMGETRPEFVLAIGDNFYSKGVDGIKDPQFDEKFEKTFTAPSLNVTWYVTSGNHDYYGGEAGIKAEIEYTNHSTRWTFPDYYHSDEVTTEDGTNILVVATDTWRMNGGDTFVKFDPVTERMALRSKDLVVDSLARGVIDQATHDTLLEHFEEEDPHDPIPWCGGGRAGSPPCEGDTAQLDWVKATLMGSNADWKLVMGHFPIYSATTHEHGDTPKLIEVLDPILHKTHADCYFSGHDHILQHNLRGNVHYFGSGAGAMKHTGVNRGYKGLMGFHEGHYGFMLHEGNKTALKTTFVIDDGSRPYSYTIQKAGGQFIGPAAKGLQGNHQPSPGPSDTRSLPKSDEAWANSAAEAKGLGEAHSRA